MVVMVSCWDLLCAIASWRYFRGFLPREKKPSKNDEFKSNLSQHFTIIRRRKKNSAINFPRTLFWKPRFDSWKLGLRRLKTKILENGESFSDVTSYAFKVISCQSISISRLLKTEKKFPFCIFYFPVGRNFIRNKDTM